MLLNTAGCKNTKAESEMSESLNIIKSPSASSSKDFFLKNMTHKEIVFVDNNRRACKELIPNKRNKHKRGADQDLGLAFWTRLCISSRQHIKEHFGNVYLSEVADIIFIQVLKKFDGSNSGEKVVDYIFGVWEIYAHQTLRPLFAGNLLYCRDAFPLNSGMNKYFKDVFPPKLLELLEVSGATNIKSLADFYKQQKLSFSLNISLALAGCLARTLSALITGEPTVPTWEVPITWQSPDCFPLELEEYLHERWRTNFADVVAMVPKSDIGWWGHKRGIRVAKTGTLSRVQSFPWKCASRPSSLPHYLTADEPDSLYAVLKQRNPNLENIMKQMPVDDTFPLLVFKCYEISMPPVLASKYHNGKIEGQHCLNLSAWFASWCCVMDHSKLKAILQTPPGSIDHANKEHLIVLKDTLANWSCPETLIQSDEPDLAMEFLEMANVRMQFLSNFTIRQQWLAVALTTVLKFELEAAPLQFCPLPDAMIKFAVEVLSMIKMTKESILLALKAHEEDCTEDLKVFVGQLMPIVVHCLSLMEKPSARDCLQGLKSKCSLSFEDTRVPSECWRLDSDLEVFYNGHPWYFAFYKDCSWTATPTTVANEKADHILKSWRSEKTSYSKYQKPQFKGLINEDNFDCINTCLGWNEKGLLLKNIIGALAFKGYIPREVELLIETHLKSEKFETPSSDFIDTDYEAMDIYGKISCHCIVLLNCIIQYRAEGKLLNSSPKTLVEKLVIQSLELYELEHLHLLSMLAGQLCDFQPESPFQCEKRHVLLIDFLVQLRFIRTKGASLSNVSAEGIFFSNYPIVFEDGLKIYKNWLRDNLTRLQVYYHNEAAHQQSERSAAVFLQYLFPCYLTLMDNSRIDVNGAQFLSQLLAIMLSEYKENLGKPKKIHNEDLISTKNYGRLYQNRILQLVNAFVDYGFKGSAEVLAEMFSKMNWCLEPSTYLNQELLIGCIKNFSAVLDHFSVLKRCSLKSILVCSKFLAQDPCCPYEPQIVRLYGVHLSTQFMTNFMESEMEFEDTKFQEALKRLTATENQAHWWRSMIYLGLTGLPLQDDCNLIGASEVFTNLWAAARAAREARGQIFDARKYPFLFEFHGEIDVGQAVKHFMGCNFDMSANFLGIHCLDLKLNRDPSSLFLKMWAYSEFCDSFTQNFGHTSDASTFEVHKSNSYNRWYVSEGIKKWKIKKDRIRPNKEILDTLEKEMKAQERRTCRMCKKKESHVANFITCSECIKTKFPKVAHYCSRLCEKRAWDSFHDEHHVLFALDMDVPSEDEVQ